jgi:hypothetical protein
LIKPAETGQTVLLATNFESLEPIYFRVVDGDNDLTADFMMNLVLLTKGHHLLNSADSQAGLDGAWFVVEPTMENATVVTRLMATDRFFLL